MPDPRPPRLRTIAVQTLANRVAAATGTDDAERFGRLEEALANLPDPERSAAVIAFGYDEGAEGVAAELGLDPDAATALTRSALQLLRGALGDIGLDEPDVFARLPRRRRGNTAAPHP